MIRLSEISTRAEEGATKVAYKQKTKALAARIGELQRIMYAQEKYSLLVIFQGMDASGKDGATRKVFRDCSISGISVKSFKKPSDLEMSHDFLWRVHKYVPKKGRIKIFNRSQYEDILIQRVHKWVSEETVGHRIEAINAFERNLVRDNDTTVLKFYLHISKKRQKEKLQERIDDPRKNWKHNEGDWAERKLWDKYMACYEDAINSSEIPWTVVPADQRWYRDYFVAQRVCEVLESIDLKLPTLVKQDHSKD